MWHYELYLLDVPQSGRKILMGRSVLNAVGILAFLESLRCLNPFTAVLAQSSTLIVLTAILRIRGTFGQWR